MSPERILDLILAILDMVMGLIGKEKLKALISLEGAERANAIADVAEFIKFGRTSVPKEPDSDEFQVMDLLPKQ